jgi:hypothetical protein
MNSDDLVYSLQRLADYGRIDESEREVVRAAIKAVFTSDDALAQAVPHLATLAQLLEVVTDAKKAARTVQQLRALVDEANGSRSAAALAIAELDNKRAEIVPQLEAAKQEHADQLALRQSAFDRRVADYQRQLSVREAAVSDLEKAAKADADAAAELRADLNARLERVRSAAA